MLFFLFTDGRTENCDGQAFGFVFDQLFGCSFRHDVSVWHRSQKTVYNIMFLLFWPLLYPRLKSKFAVVSDNLLIILGKSKNKNYLLNVERI